MIGVPIDYKEGLPRLPTKVNYGSRWEPLGVGGAEGPDNYKVSQRKRTIT